MEKQLSSIEHSRNVPMLRFPEFQGVFKEEIFDDVLSVTRLAGYEYSKYWKEDIDKEIIALRGYNIGNGKLELRDLSYISNKLSLQLKRSRLYKGDIIYPCVGSIGNAVVIEENDKYHIQQNIAKITCNNSTSPFFITQFLMSHLGMKEVLRFNATSSQPNILVGSLRQFKVNLPRLPEQQKIASFLTDVDAKITKLTKKKALLEQYKKGVMQKIFPSADSGQVPELRFKPDLSKVEGGDSGNEFPKWEEKELRGIGSIVSGLTYSPNDINDNGVLVLRSSNVKNRLIVLKNNVFVNVENGKFNPVELNDILICVRNGSKRLIGKNAIIKEEHVGLAFGAFMTVYRSVYNQFLFHFFDSQYYKKEVHKNLGATINSINGSDLKRLVVPFPSLKEQVKIASFLSDIDMKIEALNTKIENSKTFKKGLLQKMFV